MKKWKVTYSQMFVRSNPIVGTFTVDADSEAKAIEAAKSAMAAKARELKADAFRLNIEEVIE